MQQSALTFSVETYLKALRILRVVMRTQLTVEKHWFVFNFNDVVMAFATWFTQLLVA